jgi:RNA polymerase sigma-70 factor (ECF subfamily)
VIQSVARSNFDTGDLATRMLSLEDDAFKKFAQLFGPRFRAYFQRGGLSPADAEDLAVSCVTDIALKIEKYEQKEGASFSAWVFSISRNYLADWWRKNRQMEPLPTDLSVNDVKADEMTQSPSVIAVREAISTMTEDEQEIIRLRHFGLEHSYREIGNQFGITSDAARVRHFRALQKLQRVLEKDFRIGASLSTRSVD